MLLDFGHSIFNIVRIPLLSRLIYIEDTSALTPDGGQALSNGKKSLNLAIRGIDSPHIIYIESCPS